MATVLVVDDSPDARYLLRALLERVGHTVIEAEDGAIALQTVADLDCDLIISDGLMPVMDGFRFRLELGRDEKLKDIPFIFYTASFARDDDAALAAKMGAAAYLVKPADPQVILDTVESVLQRGARTAPTLDGEKLTTVLEQYGTRIEQKLDEKVADLTATRALRDSYRALLDDLPVLVTTLDLEGAPDFANRAAIAFTGSEEPGNLIDAVAHASAETMLRMLSQLLADPRPIQVEVMLRRADGIYRVIALVGTPYGADAETGLGYALVGIDVTEAAQQRELLLYTAEHDPLTGLPSRHVFNNRFDEVLHNVPKGARCALIFVEGQDLRTVNDRYGYDVGDATIANLASVLVDAAGPEALVARLCAAEFVVLIDDIGWERAQAIADRLTDRIATSPLVPAAPEHRLAVSVAVNVIPEVAEMGATPAPADRAARSASERERADVPEPTPALSFVPVYDAQTGDLVRCRVIVEQPATDKASGVGAPLEGALALGATRRIDTAVIEATLIEMRPRTTACSIPLTIAGLLDASVFERSELAAARHGVGAERLSFELSSCSAGSMQPPSSWLRVAGRSPIGLVQVCDQVDTLASLQDATPGVGDSGLSATLLFDDRGAPLMVARTLIRSARDGGTTLTVYDVDTPELLERVLALGPHFVAGDALAPPAPSLDGIKQHIDIVRPG